MRQYPDHVDYVTSVSTCVKRMQWELVREGRRWKLPRGMPRRRCARPEAAHSMRTLDPLLGSRMEADGLDAAARLAGERAFSVMALDACAVGFGVFSGCIMLIG